MSIDNKNEIEIYLTEIAERLYIGHAALMVGAGFSMNAIKGEAPSKNFPSWNDLGDCFYQKLYGENPTEKDKSYLDVLKLANEIDVTFGRPALNKMLRDEIPNLEYQPSELHEKLLQLPWVDVFTTNYDTLLERTAEKILEQRYETIINKEDLIWSTKPRIIKLHGSFPSDKPFIITEEDYRKYPLDYSPFVNTVQQSLLENTLCLIGFSSNDPNFQKWIGWIRDNLGKGNSPKIYLIGKLSLSLGEKKLLEERNIIPVDLSCFSDNHYEALSNFVTILKQKGCKAESNLNFPQERKVSYDEKNKDIQNQFDEVISIWKMTRNSYPNWLILPKENREKLRINTDYEFINQANNINTILDIEFLYEFNWRIERYLFPILNKWIISYENIVSKYNPFPEILQIDNVITPKGDKHFDWQSISKYWIELQLSILRYYREENLNEKWSFLAAQIDKIKGKLSPELLARYYYEKCLSHLFLLDILSVRNELTNWSTDTTLPYWEAKRAGLLAELGDIEDAEKILETSLNDVRSKLRLSPVKDDYLLVSQETYILQLSRYVKRSINYSKGIYELDETEKYTERWDELIKYKCDPWGELRTFESFFKTNPPIIKRVDKKYKFEIGRITNTYRLDNNNTYAEESYAFLRYIEEIGIPLRLPNITFGINAAKNAIKCIADYSPNWAFISFIRTGNLESIDIFFSRHSLSFFSQKDCDNIAINYLEVLIKSMSEIKKGNVYNNTIFAISLSTIIPEVLSRLCVKCNYNTKIKILEFVKNLYLSDKTNQEKYKGIEKLVEYLIKSFSSLELYILIPELLNFPIIPDYNTLYQFPEPFSFIHIDNSKNYKKIKVNPKIINELISHLEKNDKKRNASITRLIVLFQYKLLNNSLQDKFARELWKELDNNGFPVDINYYYFAFLNFPYPKDVNPKELLRRYIQNIELPIQGNDIGISIGADYPIFMNILGTTNREVDYLWSKKEINNLISKIIKWWNADKSYLLDTMNGFGGSTADVFKAKYVYMIRIFSNLIIYHLAVINKPNLKKISILLEEMSSYNMRSLEAKSSFISILPNEKRSLYSQIEKKLYSKDRTEILDSTNAVSVIAKQEQEDVNIFIESMSYHIKCRSETGLDIYIESINTILRSNQQLITHEILVNIQIGLEYLYDEILIKVSDNEEIVHKKLLNQLSASKLLICLKKYYIETLKINLPLYIIKWETMCLNINEFSEIRNIWLNEQDIT